MQDFQLHSSLMVESRFVSDNFHCSKRLIFVVKALENLPKRSLSKDANNLKPISKVVVGHQSVVSTVIIKSSIVLRCRLPMLNQLDMPGHVECM
jgi:hypothetical protein